MSDRIKNSNHTGKHQHKQNVDITLDSNMVAYLYLMNKPNPSFAEVVKVKKALTNEQLHILEWFSSNNFSNVNFKTTPQVVHEVTNCAKLKGDDGILKFLERICKIKIPRSREDKIKYAELIADLMEELLREDIPLNNGVRAYQSAIATEIKNGKINYADAKIVAENNILNGNPIVTRNEKHLISMEGFKHTNNFRSFAIEDKNIAFLKRKSPVIPHRRIKINLKNPLSTTFRINEIPHLLNK